MTIMRPLLQAACSDVAQMTGFSKKVHAIDDIDTLNALSLSLLRSDSLEAFEALVDKATKPTLHEPPIPSLPKGFS